MRRRDQKISDTNLIEMVMQKGTVVHIAMTDANVDRFDWEEVSYEKNATFSLSAI